MPRRLLLACGIAGSLLYAAVDVLAAIRYPAYHSFTARAVSELMASGAPTERLVDPPLLMYDALMVAFGIGVWMSGHARRLRILAIILVAYGVIGALGPTLFEMNVRGSGGPRDADVRHIALTGVLVLCIFGAVGTGASLFGRVFRDYSYLTMAIMLVFGILTGVAMRGIDTGPTPWVGLFERVNIGAFLVWIIALAIALLRTQWSSATARRGVPAPAPG